MKELLDGQAVRVLCRSADTEQVEKLHPQRDELRAMKLSALKQRAKEVGVDEGQLVEADDTEDVKSTVIELIVKQVSLV
eukprot:SAG11_NODE_15437_length_578_cov_1.189979_2_plen_79_part_00